jgi:hypothetical protein
VQKGVIVDKFSSPFTFAVVLMEVYLAVVVVARVVIIRGWRRIMLGTGGRGRHTGRVVAPAICTTSASKERGDTIKIDYACAVQ